MNVKYHTLYMIPQVRGGQRLRARLCLRVGERGEHRGARGVQGQPALRQLQTHRQGQVRYLARCTHLGENFILMDSCATGSFF